MCDEDEREWAKRLGMRACAYFALIIHIQQGEREKTNNCVINLIKIKTEERRKRRRNNINNNTLLATTDSELHTAVIMCCAYAFSFYLAISTRVDRMWNFYFMYTHTHTQHVNVYMHIHSRNWDELDLYVLNELLSSLAFKLGVFFFSSVLICDAIL